MPSPTGGSAGLPSFLTGGSGGTSPAVGSGVTPGSATPSSHHGMDFSDIAGGIYNSLKGKSGVNPAGLAILQQMAGGGQDSSAPSGSAPVPGQLPWNPPQLPWAPPNGGTSQAAGSGVTPGSNTTVPTPSPQNNPNYFMSGLFGGNSGNNNGFGSVGTPSTNTPSTNMQDNPFMQMLRSVGISG